jgi:3-oxoacyl-[acyl-carrier protein] reductase
MLPTRILHLPAGQIEYKRLKQLSVQRIQNEMQVQVYSLFEILKEFLPSMATSRNGKVVAVLSAYTRGVPPKFLADYVIVKHALLGLVKSAAAEYAAKGVSINAISPDMVETKFLDNLDERIVEMVATGKPIGRNVKISEVVSGIDFLMSDEVNCFTGENIFL